MSRTAPAPVATRIWRARRRHHHLDAELRPAAGGTWDLVFRYDDRVIVAWPFGDRERAVADAARRLADLQRAGWTVHW